MKTSIYTQLKKIRDKYGPGIFGKMAQKLLALAFYEAGYIHVVERGVQGVDIDIRNEENSYAVEVKTTDSQSILLSQDNIDALKDRTKDGYVPLIAILRMQMFEDWILATVPIKRLRASSYQISWFRSYRTKSLESLVSPHFENIVNQHTANVMKKGEWYLIKLLEQQHKREE